MNGSPQRERATFFTVESESTQDPGCCNSGCKLGCAARTIPWWSHHDLLRRVESASFLLIRVWFVTIVFASAQTASPAAN
jgi:hypothetical protein